jgi:hypothetical protein
MSASVSPCSRRLIASRFWCSVSLNGRTLLCPRATALSRDLPGARAAQPGAQAALSAAVAKVTALSAERADALARAALENARSGFGFNWCRASHRSASSGSSEGRVSPSTTCRTGP